MNEGRTVIMQDFCQACLRTGDNVSLMTLAEVRIFREVVFKSTSQPAGHLHLCCYCRCLLRKLDAFLELCQVSQNLLKDMVRQDINVLPKIPFGLRRSATKMVYVGPEPVVEEIKLDPDRSEELFGDRCSTEDEDDMPLVMLRSAGDGDSSTEEAGESRPIQATEMNGHSDSETALHKERKKKKKHREKKRNKKKPLREGFSSRMVQETDEYLVIKLTKEEVLQEMAERARSEKYLLAPYKCDKCVKGFNFEDVLRAHLEKHSPERGPLQCELCAQRCASAVSLRGHMKSHTTRYRCKVCALVRLSRQHVLEHHGIAHALAPRRYCCERCRFTTDKRTVMQHHVRAHAAREPLACPRCGKLYRSLETLRIHIARHDAAPRLRCARCRLSFVYASQLRRHARAAHERRDYYCVECDVPFNSMDTLKLHFQKAKRHRDPTSFKHACASCPQRFVSAATLATHAHAAHGAPKRVRCELCASPRAYTSRDALRVHQRRAHAKGAEATRETVGQAGPASGPHS